MKAEHVRVTVVVPAYNANRTIAACVESLMRQVPRPDEVIVVDDCSEDDTAEVAAACGATVIRLGRNSGPGVARNAAAAAARSELLAFTDADCVAPPQWLGKMLAALEQPGVVAVTGGYCGPISDSFLSRLQHLFIRERQAAMPEHIESTITSNFACRRSAFLAVGGFPVYCRRAEPEKAVWGNEDEELGYLLTRTGGRIRWLPDVGVKHLFRQTLSGYLRQQRFYAERIVMSHFRFPQMARTRSNYSRLAGALHIAAVGGLCLGLVALAVSTAMPRLTVAAGVLLMVSVPIYLALPLPMVLRLRRSGEGFGFLAAAYGVLLAVDLAWLVGAVKGGLSSLGGFTHGNDQSSAASAAARQ